MIVTGFDAPPHLSDMGAWIPVISVGSGPYETGGIMDQRSSKSGAIGTAT